MKILIVDPYTSTVIKWSDYTNWRSEQVTVPRQVLLNKAQPLYSAAVVDGGPVMNGMFFNRGSARDHNPWEKLGNPGWS